MVEQEASLMVVFGNLIGSIPLQGKPSTAADSLLQRFQNASLDISTIDIDTYKFVLWTWLDNKEKKVLSTTYFTTSDRWGTLTIDELAHGLWKLLYPGAMYQNPFAPDGSMANEWAKIYELAGYLCDQKRCPMSVPASDVARLNEESRFLRSYFKYWLAAKDKSRLKTVLRSREARIARIEAGVYLKASRLAKASS